MKTLLKTSVIGLLLFLVVLPIMSCGSFPVFFQDQDGNEYIFQGKTTIYFWKDEGTFKKVIGDSSDFFVNGQGTMQLYENYNIQDISFAEIIEGDEKDVPVGRKLEVNVNENVVYVEVHSTYKMNSQVDGLEYWVRMTTTKIDTMVYDMNSKYVAPEKEFVLKRLIQWEKTKFMASYASKDLISFGKNLIWSPIYIRPKIMGTEYPIPIPNFLIFLVYGFGVAFAAYFSYSRLIQPVFDDRKRTMTSLIWGEGISISTYSFMGFSVFYFLGSYYGNTNIGAWIAVGSLVFIAITIIAVGRLYNQGTIYIVKTIWKITKLILKGLKLVIKAIIRIILFPFVKVKDHGKEIRQEAKAIKTAEKYATTYGQGNIDTKELLLDSYMEDYKKTRRK